jgi:PKD repeat protein
MIIMGKPPGLIVIFLIVVSIIYIAPVANSQDGGAEWSEELFFEGSCSSGNVPHRFSVNDTVVEIDINISWPQGDGSDLNFWIENSSGFNVDASESFNNPEIMKIRTISERGRWTLWLYPKSCGSSGQVNYTIRVTLRNIALPDLDVSTSQIEKGEKVTMNLSSQYEHITHYFIDFGDGTHSGWSLEPVHIKTYKEPGKYTPRAKVRYDDGLESEWVKADTIEVSQGPNMVLWIGFWLLLIGLLSFGVNLAYSKRKGL